MWIDTPTEEGNYIARMKDGKTLAGLFYFKFVKTYNSFPKNETEAEPWNELHVYSISFVNGISYHGSIVRWSVIEELEFSKVPE